jgi:hypothetical protein
MISQRKIEANRRNALRSTGPRTPEGKAASCRNAFRHGAWSPQAAEPTSDPEAFALHRLEMLECLKPQCEEELALAEEVILQGWRLQRFREMEEGLYRRDQADAAEALERAGPLPPPGRARELAFSAALGEALGRTMSGACNPYQTLARQEARALRMYTACLAALRRLQAAREAAREEKSEETNPPYTPGRTPSQLVSTTAGTRSYAPPAAAPQGESRATNEPTVEGGQTQSAAGRRMSNGEQGMSNNEVHIPQGRVGAMAASDFAIRHSLFDIRDSLGGKAGKGTVPAPCAIVRLRAGG